MKRKNGILIGFLAISLACIWLIANQPKPRSWEETYLREGKNPYDTYILSRSLPSLFPSSTIVYSDRSLLEQLNRMPDNKPVNYILISKVFAASDQEQAALLKFVERGNSFFVAAEVMPGSLLKKLNVSLQQKLFKNDHIFSRPEAETRLYDFKENGVVYFVPRENFNGIKLGELNVNGEHDFVAIPYGKGYFYLNLNPRAFTNYYVLDSLCDDYSYKALSYLPDGESVTVWGGSRKPGGDEVATPFRVLLQYPSLRWALFLFVFGGLFYVIFAVRREQRAMPLVSSYENKMLDFVASVSSLYYKQKDHYRIAVKRIDFFLERVRSHYKIRTDELDDNFARQLAENSGVDEWQVKWLVGFINKMRTAQSIGEEGLKEMVKAMEKFPFYVNENKDK